MIVAIGIGFMFYCWYDFGPPRSYNLPPPQAYKLGRVSLDNATTLSINVDSSKSNHTITLTKAAIMNESGQYIAKTNVFCPSTITPQTNTTVKIYFEDATFYQQCFYKLFLTTMNDSGAYSYYFSGLTAGNFKNSSEDMVIKQVSYNVTSNNMIIKCDRIFSKAIFYFAIIDKSGDPPIIVLPPSRYEVAQDNETVFKIYLNERLTPGQYSLIGVNPRGLTVDFNVP